MQQLQKATRPNESPVPPLQNGDRLSRAEFERRSAAMPEVKKAELIEGVVYVGSAVRADWHGEPHGLVMTWLGVYRAATPGVRLADNATVRLDLDTETQPDALLRLDPEMGGQSRLGHDGYIEGAPELVVEIATSSASYDLHDKLRAYRRNGVQEYLVWRVLNRAIDWFRLDQSEYLRLEPDAEGVSRSSVFPGLWLVVPALLMDDPGTVLAKLQVGLRSPEHEAFVKRLGNS